MIYRIALIVLIAIACGRAESYPASSGYVAFPCSGGSTSVQATDTAACGAMNTTAVASCYGYTSWAFTGITAGECKGTLTGPGSVPNITGGSVGASGHLCPNGGTLSGTTCNCAPGETDTGSACTTPSCPAGQHSVGGVCVNICPAAGRAWNPLDSGDSGADGLTYPSGQKTVCSEVGFAGESGPVSDKCVVVPTGSIIVCADVVGGGGSQCYSETARYTGARCGSASDMPVETVTSCDSGDLWCRNPTGGACAAGFTGATFGNESLCIKTGESINAVPQPRSPAAPPRAADVEDPPELSDPSEQTGEETDPNDRTVVGIGEESTGINGAGPGGGGSGEDIITCGLPDSPPCKIDETGTPTGADADTEAKAGITTEAGKLTTALEGVIAGTGAADRSWGFSISFPSTCVPFNVGTSRWGFFAVDFCDFQDQAHDIMSLVWIASTIFLCIGMVFRAINAG